MLNGLLENNLESCAGKGGRRCNRSIGNRIRSSDTLFAWYVSHSHILLNTSMNMALLNISAMHA